MYVISKLTKYGEWFSSIAIMIGSLSLAFEYFVTSAIFYFIGSCSWAVVGYIWKKRSVVAMNFVIIIGFLVGWTT